jgi:DNA polymerase III psi subunit
MSAMENMVQMVLKALNVDPDEIKKEVLTRVQQFEQNVTLLNTTLTGMNEKLAVQAQTLIHMKDEIAFLRDALNKKETAANVANGRDITGTGISLTP